MDFSTGLSIVGIGAGIVVNLLAMKPMPPMLRGALFGVGWLCIVAGFWGVLRGTGDTGTPAAITPDHSVNSPMNSQASQTMTDSPGGVQIQGDVTVNQGPQPRKLTPVQEKRFVQVLKDNPKGHVAISCIESGGPEPCNFARQLKGLLESQDAGWAVTFSSMMFAAGDPTKTIPSLYLEAQTNAPPPFAFALREALKAALGREPVCLIRADQPSNFLQLTIWHNSQ